MLIRRLTNEATLRALGPTIAFAGIASSIIAVSALPAYVWTPAGLAALGVASLSSAALLTAGAIRNAPIPALFCLIYGASCIGGAALRHSNPLAPLRPLTEQLKPQARHWIKANSGGEAARQITAAVSGRQRTLIYWGPRDCQTFCRDLEEPVLDPTINPALRGLRLLVIAADDEDGRVLRGRFNVGEGRAVMLLRDDGTTVTTGPLPVQLEAVAVMQLLDFEG